MSRAKHWYRTKGSRRRCATPRCGLHTITDHDTCWRCRQGYSVIRRHNPRRPCATPGCTGTTQTEFAICNSCWKAGKPLVADPRRAAPTAHSSPATGSEVVSKAASGPGAAQTERSAA